MTDWADDTPGPGGGSGSTSLGSSLAYNALGQVEHRTESNHQRITSYASLTSSRKPA